MRAVDLSIFAVLFIFVSNPLYSSSNQPIKCKDCNVIIISLTSLRPKNMSLYDYKRKTTPNIDQFFNNSYIFENAYAPASLTFTDATSLFYSLSTNNHQNFNRYQSFKLKKQLAHIESFPQFLESKAYKTAALTSDEDYSYDRGVGWLFQYYFDRALYPDFDILFRPYSYNVGSKQLIPVANRWLEQNKNEKFLLFLQLFDMHCPYSPEGKFSSLYPGAHNPEIPFTSECFLNDKVERDKKGRVKVKSLFAFLEKKEKYYYLDKKDREYLISRYDAELTQADHNLRVLFNKIQELGLEKKSIIILLSEHGDNLGENDVFMKKNLTARGNLQRVNLNFPLAIKLPTSQKLIRQKQIIQTIDIAPTILDILGYSHPKEMEGKSFKHHLGDPNKAHNDFAYAYSVRTNSESLSDKIIQSSLLESIFNQEWKLDYTKIYMPKNNKLISESFELYDLKNDPLESRDLSKKENLKLFELKNKMTQKRNYYENLKKKK